MLSYDFMSHFINYVHNFSFAIFGKNATRKIRQLYLSFRLKFLSSAIFHTYYFCHRTALTIHMSLSVVVVVDLVILFERQYFHKQSTDNGGEHRNQPPGDMQNNYALHYSKDRSLGQQGNHKLS